MKKETRINYVSIKCIYDVLRCVDIEIQKVNLELLGNNFAMSLLYTILISFIWYLIG